MTGGGSEALRLRRPFPVRCRRFLALGVAVLMVVSAAVVVPAAAETPGDAGSAPDSGEIATTPSPNPDSPLNVISLAVSEGTEVSWEAPRPTDLAPEPTGYSVRSCGPFEIGSDELTKASAAMCAGEKSLKEFPVSAEPGGSVTGPALKQPVEGSPQEIRSDGSYKFVSECAPTRTSFCVVALASVAETGLSKPVIVGSGGIAPDAPIDLKAVAGRDGASLDLEWVAAPDVVQADDLPSLAQTFEVWRDNVLLVRGLTTPEYADKSCGLARRCSERVYAVSPAGRSAAVEVDAHTAGTSAPSMVVPDGMLNPGVSVISGSLGNGAEDERPVVVSFVPVGTLADGTTSTVPSQMARSGADGWSLEVPAALVPGRYLVTATQGTFGSEAAEVPVAPPTPLDIVLGSGPSSSVPTVASGSLTIGGTATPSPPASQLSIRDSWGAPGGTDTQRSQAELSAAFAATRAASKSTVQNVGVDALGRWMIVLGARSGLGERHVVEITQTVPGVGATTRYFEFQVSGGVIVPRTGGSSTLFVPQAPLVPTATVPAAPTGLNATAGDRSVSIRFTAGAAGTSPITNYAYQIGTGAWTPLNPVDAVSPVRITGLANGTSVSIKLRAISLAGQGTISGPISVTPRTIPSTPTGLSAVAGNAGATVTFTPGANGGSPITNYEYQLDAGPWVVPVPSVATSPLVISGLINGTASSIKIRAITAAGPSLPSLPVLVTPRTVPSAPTGLVATPGNLSASIAFTPGSTGGSTITNYEYRVGTGAWKALNPVDTSSPVTVPGLSNGTQQSIKLRAVNAAGKGAESTEALVTPRVLSAAPTSLTATPGDGSVSISFVPGAAGTSAITNYQYQIGTGVWTALNPADATSPVSIIGLTNGTAYSIKLRPVSVFGAGTASVAVTATPRVLPAAPTSLSATARNASATIAFTPGAAGTGVITNYEYQVGTGAWTAINPVDALSPVTVAGLVNGTVASIKLRAVSAYGAGTASAPVSVTPCVLASAPTALVATPLNGSASISFVAGAAGTSAITNYQYQIGTGEWTAFSPAQTGSKLTISGLSNGTLYSIKLRAVGTYGVGAESAAVTVTPRTIPSAPQYTYGVPGDRSIAINFSPGATGGSPITNYEYQIGSGAWVASVPARTTAPVTVTGLVNGTSYSIRLRAITAAGPSLPSGASTATPRVLPGAPTGLIATAGNGSVSIAFTAGTAGTSATTNYDYQLDSGYWTSVYPATNKSPVIVTDLTNGTAYSIKIRAVGVLGVGAASAAVVVTPRTKPAAPTGLVATPGDRSASIAFTAGSDGGSSITNYKYQLNGGAWTALSPTDAISPITIPGLVNGTSYRVKLLAVNVVGDGAASVEATVLSGGTPNAPSNVTVVSKDGAATLRFTAPPATGLPITGYTVSTTESSPRSFTCTSLIGTPEPVCTIGGLDNGSAYSFTVTARNSAGTSVASSATESVIIGAPDAPTDLTATPRDGSVDL
ncbi:MAG: hypothetical protein F2585_07165, partial [Actinobacteria bacterium]|nr:hypothetical protein [Actinomycetota bacterium]